MNPLFKGTKSGLSAAQVPFIIYGRGVFMTIGDYIAYHQPIEYAKLVRVYKLFKVQAPISVEELFSEEDEEDTDFDFFRQLMQEGHTYKKVGGKTKQIR